MGNITSLIFNGDFSTDVPELGQYATCRYRVSIEIKNGEKYHMNVDYNGDDGRSDAMFWDGNEKKEGTIALKEGNKVEVDTGKVKAEFQYRYENFKYFVDNFDFGVIYGLKDSNCGPISSEDDFSRILRNKSNENNANNEEDNKLVLSFLNDNIDKIDKNNKNYFWSVYKDFEMLKIFVLHGLLPGDNHNNWNIDIETPDRIQFYIDHNVLNSRAIARLISLSISKGRRDLLDLLKPEVGKVNQGDRIYLFPSFKITKEILNAHLEEGLPFDSKLASDIGYEESEVVPVLEELLKRKIIDENFDPWTRIEYIRDEGGVIVNQLLDFGFKPAVKLLSRYSLTKEVAQRVVSLLHANGFTKEEATELYMSTGYSMDSKCFYLIRSGLLDLTDKKIIQKATSLRDSESIMDAFIDAGADVSLIIPYLLNQSLPSLDLVERALSKIQVDQINQEDLVTLLKAFLFKKEFYDIYRKYLPLPDAGSLTVARELMTRAFESYYSDTPAVTVRDLINHGFGLDIKAISSIVRNDQVRQVITRDLAEKLVAIAGGKVDVSQADCRRNKIKDINGFFDSIETRDIFLYGFA